MPRHSAAGLRLAAVLVWMLVDTAELRAELRIRLEEPPSPEITLPLLAELESWIDATTDLPRRASPPAVRIVSRSQALRLSGPPARGLGRPRGLYSAQEATIYLTAPWSADRPQDVAVLLHEMIHHRQATVSYPCVGRMEEVAYRAQRKWLSQRGLELDVNWLAIIWQGGCTPRDIHP